MSSNVLKCCLVKLMKVIVSSISGPVSADLDSVDSWWYWLILNTNKTLYLKIGIVAPHCTRDGGPVVIPMSSQPTVAGAVQFFVLTSSVRAFVFHVKPDLVSYGQRGSYSHWLNKVYVRNSLVAMLIHRYMKKTGGQNSRNVVIITKKIKKIARV